MAAEAFSSQDHENLAPMLAGAKKNIQTLGKEENYFQGIPLTADSNYDICQARHEDCAACPLNPSLLSKPNASRRFLSLRVDLHEPNRIDEMKAKIDTPQGKRLYARRLDIVELVFTYICVHKHMNRFTLRTKPKVDVQCRLFALVHNIGKIHTFGALY